jgi:predicted AlkP superfamily phosphohydrolase/phosphomutase
VLLQHEPCDLFIGVLTETDRVQHFFWDALDEPSHPQRAAAYRFYNQVDRVLGRWINHVRPEDELIVLADHGFCRIEQEIFINHWLKENGYLVMKDEKQGAPLKEIDPSRTKAFSLDPGRIFINMKGRQAHGCVEPKDVGRIVDEIAAGMKQLTIKVPWSAQPFHPITHVFRAEEIYDGPFVNHAADLVLHSADGFDLKGKFNSPVISNQGSLTGMHTFGNAMLYVRGREWSVPDPRMVDIPSTIMHLMGLPVPKPMEGRVIV